MILFGISSIIMLLHILAFLGGLFSANASISLIAFCSTSFWVYPLFVVSLYRVITGNSTKRLTVLSSEEFDLLKKRRDKVNAN